MNEQQIHALVSKINDARLIPCFILGVSYTLTKAELFKETDLDTLETIFLLKCWFNFEGETSVFETAIITDPEEIRKMLPIETGQL